MHRVKKISITKTKKVKLKVTTVIEFLMVELSSCLFPSFLRAIIKDICS